MALQRQKDIFEKIGLLPQSNFGFTGKAPLLVIDKGKGPEVVAMPDTFTSNWKIAELLSSATGRLIAEGVFFSSGYEYLICYEIKECVYLCCLNSYTEGYSGLFLGLVADKVVLPLSRLAAIDKNPKKQLTGIKKTVNARYLDNLKQNIINAKACIVPNSDIQENFSRTVEREKLKTQRHVLLSSYILNYSDTEGNDYGLCLACCTAAYSYNKRLKSRVDHCYRIVKSLLK